MPIRKPKLSFSEIEKIRKKDALKAKQAQALAGLTQIKSSFLEKNIPSSLKLKGIQALGKRVLDIVKNKIFKIIIPKIQQLKDKYSIQAFQEAKAKATTPQQINQIKKQFCPTKSELVKLVQTRNNIVSQLNVIGKNINTIGKTVDRLQRTTKSLDRLLKQINKTKISVSLAAKFIPPMAFPGSIASLLNDLETIDDNLVPLIEKNKGALSAVPIPIAVALSTIDKIKKILNQLDILITFCAIPPTDEKTTISRTETTLGTQGTETTLSTQGTETTLSTQGTETTLSTQGTETTLGTQGTETTLGTQGIETTLGTQGTETTLSTQGTETTLSTQGTETTLGTQETLDTLGTNTTPTLQEIINAQNILGIELTPFSEDINNISLLLNQIENEETISGSEGGGENNYNGFIIQIEEVPFNDKIIRKRAIGLDKNGVKLVQTELSFTTNPQTLIEELKLIIDRDNLKAY
jgi:hypothetical protein